MADPAARPDRTLAASRRRAGPRAVAAHLGLRLSARVSARVAARVAGRGRAGGSAPGQPAMAPGEARTGNPAVRRGPVEVGQRPAARWQGVRAGLVGLAMVTAVGGAVAQSFPAKPVRVVVPYAAGGPVDTVARSLATGLASAWGQQVVVDNRGGSGGALGASQVARAAPDGYTLLVTNSGPITAYPHLRRQLLFEFERDLAPVSLLTTSSLVLSVHPALPARSLQEFVALARRHPGKLSYATSGTGGVQHLAMLLLESRAGIRLLHVPYKGSSQAVADLVSGEVPVQFNSVLGTLPLVQAGKMRALGVTSPAMIPALPGVAPIAATYPGFELTSWLALYGPAGLPAARVEQLHRDAATVLGSTESRRRLGELGLDVTTTGPAELVAYARREHALFGRLIAEAGIERE